jgi:hypothetical protein
VVGTVADHTCLLSGVNPYLCMPHGPVWSLGVIGFAIVNGPAVFLLWPLYVLALAGLNYILADLFL